MPRRRQQAGVGTDTRSRIIDEAAKLFYLNGYKKTTMRALASAVGIQHPSLFAFFENKGAIAAVLLTRYYRGIHLYAEKINSEIREDFYAQLASGELSPDEFNIEYADAGLSAGQKSSGSDASQPQVVKFEGLTEYICNILVFYALNYLTIYRDERFASFYSEFSEEDREKTDEVAVSLKLLHESEYTAPSEPVNEFESMIHELDYRLIGHISTMLVQLLNGQNITARDAAIYFAAKKIEFRDTMWDEVPLDSVIRFYENNWDRIAGVKIDVYSDFFSNASLDPQ